MKRVAILISVAALAGACGSKSPNGPSNTPTVFVVALRASNEVPPITGTEANASGTATITVNTVKDASGNVTSGTFDFNVSLTGFPDGTKLTLAHIHTGATGVSGSPIVNTGLSSGDNIVLTNGSGTFSKTGVEPKTVADLQSILNNPQGFYFNVHTTVSPNGAVRGQMK